MNPKTKRFVWLGAVLVVVLAAILSRNQGGLLHNQVEIVGGLESKDIHAICYAVEEKMVPSIWASVRESGLKDLAGILNKRRESRSLRIVRVERRTPGFVVVIGKYPSTEASQERYMFWSVFQEGRLWKVERGVSIPDYHFDK